MRVLHLAAGNIYGGIESVLVAYAAGRGACPQMIPYFGVTFPGQLETDLRSEGADVTVLGPARLSKRATVEVARRAVERLLSRCNPDVVVTHGPWVHALFGPVVKCSEITLAIFLHNPPIFTWVDLLARRIRPDLGITNSHFTLLQSKAWLGATPTTICTCPVQQPSSVNRETERERLSIRPDTVLVLQASRLAPYKGHRLHLQALSRVKREANWHALFVGAQQPGKERYAKSLEGLRDELGLTERVQFLGHRTDVRQLMAASDIFCHPNVSPEPFGLVFVEAMLASLPVIATKLGGAEEILQHGGGRLVAPTVGDVAGALRELIRDRGERERIGHEGRELARTRFGVEHGVRELGDTLSRLVSGSSLPPDTRAWA